MIPVHIFWSYPLLKSSAKLENAVMMMLSAAMLKDLYGEVHIITDYKGEYIIKSLELEYSYIHKGLDHTDKNFPFPTSKLLAQKLLSERLNNYITIDYDIFITEKIPDKEHIIQADEGRNPYPYCMYQHFKEVGLKLDYNYSLEDLRFYNMGILKTSKDVIDEYYRRFFNALYRNQHLYGKTEIFDWLMFLEQNYIYRVMKDKGIEPYQHYPRHLPTYNGFIQYPGRPEADRILTKYHPQDIEFEDWYDCPAVMDNIDKTKFIHLIHYKNVNWVFENVYRYAAKNYPEKLAKLLSNLKRIL